ncbi:MspA family porin [Rhodococcoides fascians]|uniref:MspA family porin n=1 Tax=Rhodococcoides fascians TaxID=1828 RepID=UPI00050C130A|nr:MspA family porin [Rhodococcus fascians]MBY4380891.1 MspA family porin [Rhodococcus fascians]MBY4395619.1 MspA family porin [Rhodococcus fascians]MBY4404939.1 MspA family porin [Rhodococcus fascians]MBY4420377.1 MspA family porin [Rhodococcus fascians]MBY4459390.1 MspA family porin [Rhodococcus fascians]
MTEIQKSRRSRGLKSMSVAVAASASVVGLVLGTGTASAAVDSSNSVVDADGNTITVTLSDTFINGVAPLDGSPLTREWFANGKASYDVQGPSADDFEGTLKIGYQIGYPMSLGGGVTVSWASPTAKLGIGSSNTSTVTGTSTAGQLLSPGGLGAFVAGAAIEGVGESTSGLDVGVDLLPQATGTIALTNGPGVVQSESAYAVKNDSADITSAEGDAAGTSGSIQVANLHGTATEILGNVTIRPYVSLTSATGDTAITYGVPVRLN